MSQWKSSLQVLTTMLLVGCGNQDALLEPTRTTGDLTSPRPEASLAALSAKTSAMDVTSSTDAWLASLPAGFAENQDILLQFNGWLEQQPSIHEAGYVASIHDATTRSITMLWNGQNSLPDAVIRRASTDGIALKTRSWLLSYAQIQTAARTLVSLDRNFFGAFGFNLADVVGIDPSFQGVSIEGTFRSSVSDVAAAVDQLTARAQALVGVTVRVIPNVSAGPATGRGNDHSPFSAGGCMLSPSTDELCSSGFAIETSGVTHTTTARHCISTDFAGCDDLSSKYANGSSTVVNPGAARYLGGAGAPRVWDGAYDREGYQKTVVDYADPAIGTEVCTDGGNSGVHCNVKVTSLSVYFDDGYGPIEMIRGVQQTAGQIASIQGDSGGPVIVPTWPCLFGIGCRVRAAGMIQAYSGSVAIGSFCGPVRFEGTDADPNICSDGVLFTSMRTIVNGIPGSRLVHG